MRKWPFGLTAIAAIVFSCNESNTLFELIPSSRSGITFNNTIVESDSLNPVDVTNIYNGGGVAIADFNNDGRPDVYFTGNMVSNKLYLNLGDMQFEDVTATSNTGGEGKWCRGASAVDINNDGWMDLYVCASINNDPEKRRNLLYINKGPKNDGTPQFENQAAAYGLDDDSHSTMAAFFDYDNDGDLDMYLVVNEILRNLNPSVFKPKVTDGGFPSTGRLYQNNMDAAKGHPVFTDVTRQAGVTIEGYGHGVTVADINKDGWKDLFVTNDFVANDLLYINNHDGTFTDQADSYMKHTSANGMGQDIIDINNDGLSDIVELDMSPEDNYRKKMMLNPGSYHGFQLSDFYKYQYQYVRNTLQVNLGPRVNANDSIGDPVFADLGFYSGIAETDWSWTPLVSDFNNDGLRDIIVTNGFPKDVTDHDFIAYRMEAGQLESKSNLLEEIPQVKLHNYAFSNAGDCRFTDVSKDWGFEKPTFANGAAYADLDNDGDLDVVINNINDEASVYENKLRKKRDKSTNYFAVQLKGDKNNLNGIGAWVEIYYNGKQQAYEQTPYRGYLSTVQLNPYFGLDSTAAIDSVVVKWPDGSMQVMRDVKTNQTMVADKSNAKDRYQWGGEAVAANSLFTDVTAAYNVNYVHEQEDFNDFNQQKLLPHKFSEYGPSLAAGDLNGDGIDDLVIGGNNAVNTTILIQQAKGGFTEKKLPFAKKEVNTFYQDMGIALFDADNDSDPDIYIAHGGYETKPGSEVYQDVFYINDGKGNFKQDTAGIPKNVSSKSCVRPFDFDKDGDLDLFIGGRVEPWRYPQPVSAYIYRNDSKPNHIAFTDVTGSVAPDLKDIGLICDAIVSDYDGDGWPELILAGEWMPVTFLKNNRGKFTNETAASGIAGETGWWNSIVSGDFDNDNDMDYVVGNLGQNSFYKATKEHPVSVYAKDFDKNDNFDAFLSLYLPTSQDSLDKKEYPAHLRDEALKQMISIRAKFVNYKSYAKATMSDLLTKEQLENAYIAKARNFNSAFIKNEGNGKFSLSPLPWFAQLSLLNGMVVDDFDGDGNLDLVINTNDYSTNVSVGRYDALNGLLLIGDGKGNFSPKSIVESGIFIAGNGKALVKLRSAANEYLLAASQNRGKLKLYKLKNAGNITPRDERTIGSTYIFPDGRKRMSEYYGSSFLSQSSKFFMSPGK